jgi:hypothetical protein
LAPPSPPAPLASPAAAERHHSLARAFLISGLILLAGAILGAAGFVFEQSGATWRPQVKAAGDGWRVSTSHGLRLGSSALGGDYLVWEAGPFTLLTDLRSGKSKLLGASTSASSATAPSAADRFVVWLQSPSTAARDAVVWVYDLQRARRTRLQDMSGVSRSPAVSGTTAVWEAGGASGGSPQIRGADLVTGRRFSLGASGGAGQLIISGTLVAWASAQSYAATPPLITVVDMANGRRWNIPPYAPGQGDLLGIALAGRTLVWARAMPGAQADQIIAYDLDGAAVRIVAQTAGVVPPAADGDLVVWGQPSAEGGMQISGLRLSGGGTFPIESVPGGSVRSVMVSANTVAWHVDGTLLFNTYLQTTRLP